jgi:hypothetical protein
LLTAARPTPASRAMSAALTVVSSGTGHTVPDRSAISYCRWVTIDWVVY